MNVSHHHRHGSFGTAGFRVELISFESSYAEVPEFGWEIGIGALGCLHAFNRSAHISNYSDRAC